MLAAEGAFAQSSKDTVYAGDVGWWLQDDTLRSSQGVVIYVGEALYAGQGSAESGRYKTVGFKSSMAFPLMFMRGTQISQNSDYQADNSSFDADKVKESFSPGTKLTVHRIRNRGRGKKWHYFELYLWDGKSGAVALKYRCDIAHAIQLGEVVARTPMDAGRKDAKEPG